MVIHTVTTMALYCPRCGKLQKHDISRFSANQPFQRELYCSCGQWQASFSSACRRQYLLRIPCTVCQSHHIICLDSKQFWRAQMEKIYCGQENLEIGFIGDRKIIEHTIADHKREIDNAIREMDSDEYGENIENPRVMLEILNRVHDIAEKGGVYCQCGSAAVEIVVLPNGVELVCAQCGTRLLVPAQDEQDILYLAAMDSIELMSQCHLHRKH
ncbi:MAG: hypothetical protein ABFC84_19050 [Veillonellales bacterium]